MVSPVWRKDVEGRAFRRFSSTIRGTGKDILTIMVKAQNKRAVDLDSEIVKRPTAARNLKSWESVFGVGEIVVESDSKPHENPGTSRPAHLANEPWIIGNIDRHRTPHLVERRSAWQSARK